MRERSTTAAFVQDEARERDPAAPLTTFVSFGTCGIGDSGGSRPVEWVWVVLAIILVCGLSILFLSLCAARHVGSFELSVEEESKTRQAEFLPNNPCFPTAMVLCSSMKTWDEPGK